jgi:hypothetical protein
MAAQQALHGQSLLSALQQDLLAREQIVADAQAALTRRLSLVGPSAAARVEAIRELDMAKAHSAAASQNLFHFIACEARLIQAAAALASAESARASVLLQSVSADDVRDLIVAVADKAAANAVAAAEDKVTAAEAAFDNKAKRVSADGVLGPRQLSKPQARAAVAHERAKKLLLSAVGELDTARERQRTAGQDALFALAAKAHDVEQSHLVALLVACLAAVLPTSASGDDTRPARAALGDLRSLYARLNPRRPTLCTLLPKNRGKTTCFYTHKRRYFSARLAHDLAKFNAAAAARAAAPAPPSTRTTAPVSCEYFPLHHEV